MCTAIEWYCWPGATHRDRIDCHILSVAAVVLPWPNQCDSWAFPVMALSIANIPSCVVYKWSCTLHATDCNSFISASYSFTQSINRDIMTADWKRRSVYHEWTRSWHTLWTLCDSRNTQRQLVKLWLTIYGHKWKRNHKVQSERKSINSVCLVIITLNISHSDLNNALKQSNNLWGATYSLCATDMDFSFH